MCDGDDVDGSTRSHPGIYRLQEVAYNEDKDFVAAGGFGVVYQGRLKRSNEVVALKVFAKLQNR